MDALRFGAITYTGGGSPGEGGLCITGDADVLKYQHFINQPHVLKTADGECFLSITHAPNNFQINFKPLETPDEFRLAAELVKDAKLPEYRRPEIEQSLVASLALKAYEKGKDLKALVDQGVSLLKS